VGEEKAPLDVEGALEVSLPASGGRVVHSSAESIIRMSSTQGSRSDSSMSYPTDAGFEVERQASLFVGEEKTPSDAEGGAEGGSNFEVERKVSLYVGEEKAPLDVEGALEVSLPASGSRVVHTSTESIIRMSSTQGSRSDSTVPYQTDAGFEVERKASLFVGEEKAPSDAEVEHYQERELLLPGSGNHARSEESIIRVSSAQGGRSDSSMQHLANAVALKGGETSDSVGGSVLVIVLSRDSFASVSSESIKQKADDAIRQDVSGQESRNLASSGSQQSGSGSKNQRPSSDARSSHPDGSILEVILTHDSIGVGGGLRREASPRSQSVECSRIVPADTYESNASRSDDAKAGLSFASSKEIDLMRKSFGSREFTSENIEYDLECSTNQDVSVQEKVGVVTRDLQDRGSHVSVGSAPEVVSMISSEDHRGGYIHHMASGGSKIEPKEVPSSLASEKTNPSLEADEERLGRVLTAGSILEKACQEITIDKGTEADFLLTSSETEANAADNGLILGETVHTSECPIQVLRVSGTIATNMAIETGALDNELRNLREVDMIAKASLTCAEAIQENKEGKAIDDASEEVTVHRGEVNEAMREITSEVETMDDILNDGLQSRRETESTNMKASNRSTEARSAKGNEVAASSNRSTSFTQDNEDAVSSMASMRSDKANEDGASLIVNMRSEGASLEITKATISVGSEDANQEITTSTTSMHSEDANQEVAKLTATMNSEEAHQAVSILTAITKSKDTNQEVSISTTNTKSEDANQEFNNSVSTPDNPPGIWTQVTGESETDMRLDEVQQSGESSCQLCSDVSDVPKFRPDLSIQTQADELGSSSASEPMQSRHGERQSVHLCDLASNFRSFNGQHKHLVGPSSHADSELKDTESRNDANGTRQKPWGVEPRDATEIAVQVCPSDEGEVKQLAGHTAETSVHLCPSDEVEVKLDRPANNIQSVPHVGDRATMKSIIDQFSAEDGDSDSNLANSEKNHRYHQPKSFSFDQDKPTPKVTHIGKKKPYSVVQPQPQPQPQPHPQPLSPNTMNFGPDDAFSLILAEPERKNDATIPSTDDIGPSSPNTFHTVPENAFSLVLVERESKSSRGFFSFVPVCGSVQDVDETIMTATPIPKQPTVSVDYDELNVEIDAFKRAKGASVASPRFPRPPVDPSSPGAPASLQQASLKSFEENDGPMGHFSIKVSPIVVPSSRRPKSFHSYERFPQKSASADEGGMDHCSPRLSDDTIEMLSCTASETLHCSPRAREVSSRASKKASATGKGKRKTKEGAEGKNSKRFLDVNNVLSQLISDTEATVAGETTKMSNISKVIQEEVPDELKFDRGEMYTAVNDLLCGGLDPFVAEPREQQIVHSDGEETFGSESFSIRATVTSDYDTSAKDSNQTSEDDDEDDTFGPPTLRTSSLDRIEMYGSAPPKNFRSQDRDSLSFVLSRYGVSDMKAAMTLAERMEQKRLTYKLAHDEI